MMPSPPAWLAAGVFGAGSALLAFVGIHALHAGAESYSGVYSERTARRFEDLFLFVPPRRIAELGWVCAAVGFAAVFLLIADFRSPAAMLTAGAAGIAAGAVALRAPDRLLRVLLERRRQRFNAQLVEALAQMSNALRAGFSITQAFEYVARNADPPISQEFDVLLRQTRVGIGLSEAMSHLEQRVGSEDLTLVVNAIDTARRAGGNLTEIFEKISFTIRERIRIEGRIRALTAQGRLQGIILSAMPVVIAAAMTLVSPHIMLPFFDSPLGAITVAAVILLIALGALMIRKIIRIDI